MMAGGDPCLSRCVGERGEQTEEPRQSEIQRPSQQKETCILTSPILYCTLQGHSLNTTLACISTPDLTITDPFLCPIGFLIRGVPLYSLPLTAIFLYPRTVTGVFHTVYIHTAKMSHQISFWDCERTWEPHLLISPTHSHVYFLSSLSLTFRN